MIILLIMTFMRLHSFNSNLDNKLLVITLKIIQELIILIIINFEYYLFFIKIELNMIFLHQFLIENSY